MVLRVKTKINSQRVVMAAVILNVFKIFCGLGFMGPLIGGLLAPLVPLSPINIIVYFAFFGIVYGIKNNPLNKKDDSRNLGRSFRNAFFLYLPSMCMTYMFLLYGVCKAQR